MELVYHTGDEYVPSFESDSLQVLTYVRLAKCEIRHTPTCYTWKSSTGKLPFLAMGKQVLSGSDEILQYLTAKGHDLDTSLTAEEKATSLAFKALLKEKLQPSLLYLQWMDAKNYVEFTRLWYANHLPFPLTLVLPNLTHRAVKWKLSTSVSRVTDCEMNENVFVAEGVNCLDVLAQQLGDKQYMLGSSPTSLDATVFANLCLIAQQPLPGNNALWKHLHSHSNLVDYCSRMRNEFFPELTETPYPSESTDDGPSIPSVKDPGLWAIVGLGVIFLGLQYWRYRVPETASDPLPTEGSIDDVDIS
jgi:glutathione S-transferase